MAQKSRFQRVTTKLLCIFIALYARLNVPYNTYSKHVDKTTTNHDHNFVHTLVFYKYSFLKSLILQNHEERCPDKVVECPSQNCTVKLARRLVEEHLMTSCPWRIVCCPFCSENHPKSQELVSNGFLLTWSICTAFGLFNNENNHYLYHCHYLFNINSIIIISICLAVRYNCYTHSCSSNGALVKNNVERSLQQLGVTVWTGYLQKVALLETANIENKALNWAKKHWTLKNTTQLV